MPTNKVKALKFGNSQEFPLASVDIFEVIISDTNGSLTSSKSSSEIEAAIAAGDIIKFINEDGLEGHLLDSEYAAFFCITDNPGVPTIFLYSIEVFSVIKNEYNLEQVCEEITLSGTTVTISTPQHQGIYKCGTLTSLTISSIYTGSDFVIIFTSDSTPTTLTLPSNLHMPDNFEVVANTRYEINVSGGYALVGSWEVSA